MLPGGELVFKTVQTNMQSPTWITGGIQLDLQLFLAARTCTVSCSFKQQKRSVPSSPREARTKYDPKGDHCM